MNLKKILGGHSPSESVEVRSQGTNTLAGVSPEEKIVTLQAHLQQTSERCNDLTVHLQKTRQECASLEGAKNSLEQRLSDQDRTMIDMKQDFMRMKLTNQSLEADKEELHRKLEEKEQQINDLKKQLGGKEKVVQEQKKQFDDAVRNLSAANKAKACLTARLMEQDRKLAILEQVRNQKPLMREELQVAREALCSLRSSFKPHDPQHHTIDTLEQSIALLMERLHMAEVQKIAKENPDLKRLNFDSTGDPKRSPITSYVGYPLSRIDGQDYHTKVVYFTERSVTPFMSSIPKRLGEITLRDFKQMFDRPGNFRYHFKSMDPEYGMVKEEIMHEDDILPGWDGKVIAWVEEDYEEGQVVPDSNGRLQTMI